MNISMYIVKLFCSGVCSMKRYSVWSMFQDCLDGGDSYYLTHFPLEHVSTYVGSSIDGPGTALRHTYNC